MLLQPTSSEGFVIEKYSGDAITILGKEYSQNLLLMPERAPEPWAVTRFEEIQQAELQFLFELKPDVILLGCGEKQHFLPPELHQFCFNQRLGVDCMTSRSAVRTYNVLAAERRLVLLALILG